MLNSRSNDCTHACRLVVTGYGDNTMPPALHFSPLGMVEDSPALRIIGEEIAIG